MAPSFAAIGGLRPSALSGYVGGAGYDPIGAPVAEFPTPIVSPGYVSEQPRDAFQLFFGVEAQPDAPNAASDVEEISYTERLQSQAAESIRGALQRAVDAFRRATTGHTEATREEMSRAASLLAGAADADRHQALACLLAFHVHLEREQIDLATYYLFMGLRRDPLILSKATPTLAKRFGDFDEATGRSQFLDEQMERYIRIGGLNPNSPVARVIEAYSAWVWSGDRRRVENALSSLGALDVDEADRPDIDRFTWAMESLITAPASEPTIE